MIKVTRSTDTIDMIIAVRNIILYDCNAGNVSTIFKNVLPHMEIAQEEVFGPVAPIITVEDEKEAVRIANDSKFGLGASIWTQNLDKAEALSSIVQSGIVTVNNVVVSDPRVPFGGIKNSGFGRELSRFGMLEFVNIKSVRFYDQLIYEHYVE
jgi:succinate-semialdehyde dehydrogenase/glutarate-semialdehyde dehydrogenase/succinyl-CoA reductase